MSKYTFEAGTIPGTIIASVSRGKIAINDLADEMRRHPFLEGRVFALLINCDSSLAEVQFGEKRPGDSVYLVELMDSEPCPICRDPVMHHCPACGHKLDKEPEGAK